jgi:hypothetical protein
MVLGAFIEFHWLKIRTQLNSRRKFLNGLGNGMVAIILTVKTFRKLKNPHLNEESVEEKSEDQK